MANVIRTRINEDTELVIDAERSVTIRTTGGDTAFSEDDAYKIFATLQSVLFPGVPYEVNLFSGEAVALSTDQL